MTPRSNNDPNELTALGKLTKLAREAPARPTSAELEAGLRALFARVAARKLTRARVVRRTVVALAAAVCVLVGFRWAFLKDASPGQAALGYRVEGGSVLDGGYLRQAGGGGMRLLFEEGSKVVFEAGARGRLRSVDGAGSRVVVDHGTATFDVARSKERRWFVEAGPFLVAVKGTLFTVSWSPSSEHFELRLRHGSVVVSGPITRGDIELRAGQRLVVDLPKAEALITEDINSASAPNVASSAPVSAGLPPADALNSAEPFTASPAGVGPGAAPTKGITSKADRKIAWAEQMASGHWDRILEEVERAGVNATLEQASSEDLFALADAARYRRRIDLARSALLAQRRRFPNAARSLDAVFLLGRVEESRDKSRAIAWYSEYLEHVTTGAYAAEALGRKMVLTQELKGREAAKPLAEEYLRRFPKGSYGKSAKALSVDP